MKVEEIKLLGYIKLGNKAYAIDPCYDLEQVRRDCLISNVKSGLFVCHLAICDAGAWGKRVKSISVSSVDNKDVISHTDKFLTGVDSGQCGIFDSKYYEDNHDTNSKNEWYNRVCDITQDNFGGNIDNAGTVSRAGFGDGYYEVVVERNSFGKAVEIEIIFI